MREEHELARRLGGSNGLSSRVDLCLARGSDPWPLFAAVRGLTIPATLPPHLRPLLGKELQTTGRLAQVSSVRCRWFVKVGDVVGWIELDSIRAGRPECMTDEERFTLDNLDTPDGLLKTVLESAGARLRTGLSLKKADSASRPSVATSSDAATWLVA